MSEAPTGRAWLAWLIAMIVIAAAALAVFAGHSHARDLGQWEGADPELRAWYQGLMQPGGA